MNKTKKLFLMTCVFLVCTFSASMLFSVLPRIHKDVAIKRAADAIHSFTTLRPKIANVTEKKMDIKREVDAFHHFINIRPTIANVTDKKMEIKREADAIHPFMNLRPKIVNVTEKKMDIKPDISIINPHMFNYISNPSEICSTRQIDLIIAVPVSRTNFHGRNVISQTWGSFAKDPKNNAVLLFFIGNGTSTEEPDIDKRIREESVKYQNIVHEDYIDTYQNLSLKTVSILKWVNAFCAKATFLSKIDDDMYANIPNLLSILRHNERQFSGKFIIGHALRDLRPNRKTTSKWYASMDQYSHSHYPDFVSGTSYAMPVATARLLYTASLQLPLFWLEDVYVTGLCAKKAGVPIIDNPGMVHYKLPTRGCTFKHRISAHQYSPSEMQQIHEELYSPINTMRC